MLEKTFHSTLPNLSKYKNMEENHVVSLAKEGDTLASEFLISKYKELVILVSIPYFLVGGDSDDIVQEGMLGLAEAVSCYDSKKGTSFISFLKMCVKRKIITAINRASRKKHEPLNNYISFDSKIYCKGSEQTLIDTLQEDIVSDPMEVYIEDESIRGIKEEIEKSLSPLEYEVFIRFLNGKNYKEITKELGKDYKCVDNSLQRVRKKLIRVICNKD